MKSLIRRGVPAASITSTFYGDAKPVSLSSKSREENIRLSRRVEFILRKTDLYQEGRKVGGEK